MNDLAALTELKLREDNSDLIEIHVELNCATLPQSCVCVLACSHFWKKFQSRACECTYCQSGAWGLLLHIPHVLSAGLWQLGGALLLSNCLWARIYWRSSHPGSQDCKSSTLLQSYPAIHWLIVIHVASSQLTDRVSVICTAKFDACLQRLNNINRSFWSWNPASC